MAVPRFSNDPAAIAPVAEGDLGAVTPPRPPRRAPVLMRERRGIVGTVPWPFVSLTVVGLLLLAVASIWDTAPPSGTCLKWSVAALAAASAFVADDTAAEAVAATPTRLRSRCLARLACAAVGLVVGIAGLAVVLIRSGGLGRAGISAQFVGCLLVTMAATAVVRRRFAEPGEVVGAAMVGLVVALGIPNPFGRWIELFPTESGPHWGDSLAVWSLVLLASTRTLTHATRDPLD